MIFENYVSFLYYFFLIFKKISIRIENVSEIKKGWNRLIASNAALKTGFWLLDKKFNLIFVTKSKFLSYFRTFFYKAILEALKKLTID